MTRDNSILGRLPEKLESALSKKDWAIWAGFVAGAFA